MKHTVIEIWLRRAIDSFAGAVFGGLVYAAWATFANWDAGPRLALGIGLTHWLTSTFITYSGTGVMRQFFGAATTRRDGALLSFVAGLAYTYIVLLAVHYAIGTPHIPLTLAAGVIPNVLFCSSYALLLARTRNAIPLEAYRHE
ncbi:MAG: hypothetical protein V4709_00375 [Pseudomonadota bacterium]